nr:FGGY-family carbohydrate kinase [Maliibacterium massiliense]
MAILIMEASTSSAKAMVYDAARGVQRVVTEAYPASVSDVATHDALGVFDAMMAAGKACAQGYAIDCVSLGGTWHSMVMLDEAMQPTTRCLTWAYTGAAATAAKLRQDEALTAELYGRTGCMVHTIYPAYKYLSLKARDALGGGRYVAGQSDYNFYRLTGNWWVSHSMASGTALLNTHSLAWDEKMLALTGLTPDCLPQLVTHEQTAPLLADMAARLGVPAGIPVVSPHPDGALNQVGAGAMAPRVMTLSVGTSAALRMAFDRPVLPAKPGGTWCYVGPGKWLCGAATSGATNCVDWFVKTLLGKQYSFDELEQMARDVQGDYPVFTPFLYGERCPGWRDDALGAFDALSGAYGPGHMYRALLEGILMNVYHCYTMLTEVGETPAHIRVSGGILKNAFWTQMLADILQCDIECADMEQASMLGSAALGLHVVGQLDDLGAFDPGKNTVVHPNPAMKEHYQKRFARYLVTYNKAN